MIPRCFVDSEAWRAPLIRIGPDDSHHWLDVLRVKEGDRAVVSDGCGMEAVGEIEGAGGGMVTVRVLERRRQDSASTALMLIQAIPKSQKMEWIIQKATELGVWSVAPVITERGVVKLDDERAEHRTARWQRIAVEAAKQCRTAWIPKVEPVVRFKGLMESRPRVDVMLIGSLEPEAVSLTRCLAELSLRRPNSLALLIGPEGDFSPAENEAARAAGAIQVSFGARTLRVETAAIFGLSVLAHTFGTLGEPGLRQG
jgi:16S rRNA (uracil1498-N3)-methyltransferase